MSLPLRRLLSLPHGMASAFGRVEPRLAADWSAASDPPGAKLGSGGGLVWLVEQAWIAAGRPSSLEDWLADGHVLSVLSGGMSRRLPAYAAVGKALMPLPALRWSVGQRPDQTLLDFIAPPLVRALQGDDRPRLMVVAGDVLMRFAEPIPPLPDVDVAALGVFTTPDKAEHFGVFVTDRDRPGRVDRFLQKPSPDTLRALSAREAFLLDIGIWALSPRAVGLLLSRCGWNSASQALKPTPYGLYGEFGPALGDHPARLDPKVAALTSAVVPVSAEFYHLGASRQLIGAVSALHNVELDPRKLGGMTSAYRHPDQHVQNACFGGSPTLRRNQRVWVENACLNGGWRLEGDHVVTGVPKNDWAVSLPDGACLDAVPVGEREVCLRPYGIDDPFRGAVGDLSTLWLSRPAAEWFARRGIDLAKAGIEPSTDLQLAPLFPCLACGTEDGELVQWMVALEPADDPKLRQRWMSAMRLSAEELAESANLDRLAEQRRELMVHGLQAMARNHRQSMFYKLDLAAVAEVLGDRQIQLPPQEEDGDPVKCIHAEMLEAAMLRRAGKPGWEEHEGNAFACLRSLVLDDPDLRKARPRCDVQEDQIVWSRSPVRLDLAGGWTDTPPYCILHGGRVLNVAFDLNGQPPIQVFAKRSERPELVLRSIDLGVESRVGSYEELTDYAKPGSAFALAKAALALAGFEPQFHAEGGHANLKAQLEAFGSGIELSLLAAVPKGSGLGTSSILAATTLGALSELCGLGWSRSDVVTRTLALEQLLTTGGGWQDQAGGVFRGAKVVESQPGVRQDLTYRWLPDHLFTQSDSRETVLLYYTGITRLAKNLLQEIVRGMFLNSGPHLRVIEEIGANVQPTRDAIERGDLAGLHAAIRRSWELNQRLDAGTNTPEVQAILDRIQDWVGGLKLLGAGGGGYLLILAKDREAARRIRAELEGAPPNARARFVAWSLSETGMQTTRS